MNDNRLARPWQTTTWFNCEQPLTLEGLRGRVVVLHAFQMLCPGCAVHGLPQAQRLHEHFDTRDVAVVGLHTVFEHHEAMRPANLAVFLKEYRYSFPVGVDQPRPGEQAPYTMAAYALRGTPSLVLIDRAGVIRQQYFARIDDLMLGAQIATLVADSPPLDRARAAKPATTELGA